MPLLPYLVLLSAQASDPLGRYAAFMKAHPAFSVAFTVDNGSGVRAKGRLLVERPGRLRLETSAGKASDVISLTERGYREVAPDQRQYDELPKPGGLGVYPSRLSWLPDRLFPGFLLNQDLSEAFPKEATRTVQGDRVEFTYADPMQGTIRVAMTVDAAGHLTSFARTVGQGTLTWRFQDYGTTSPGLAAFLVPIPKGYVPHALAPLSEPMQKGGLVPLSGWRSPNGQTVDLKSVTGGKPFLLSVLDRQGPSQHARASLGRLSGKLPVVIVGPGGYADPDGSRLRALGVPARPMFYLVDADGKVAALWMGYDPDKANAFEKDVDAALKGE